MEIITLDDRITLRCAFRYALGRKTYVVSSVVDTILDNWKSLPDIEKEAYKKEIRNHEREWGDLGDKCDKEEWNKILEAI